MADGGLFRNKDGVYCIRYELPRLPDGTRRQKYESLPGMNLKQARAYRAQRLAEIHGGGYIPESNLLFADYLRDWLDHQESRLKPTTLDSYRKYVHRRIIPQLGHYRLDTLTPYTIEQFYASLQRDGLAAKTVANIHGIIRAALGHACRRLILPRNPAALVSPPSVKRQEIRTASDEEIVRLFTELDRSKYRIPALIGLATGMRRGEVLALQWRDFHPNQNVLMVRRSLCQTPGKVEITDTKTGVVVPSASPVWYNLALCPN